MTSDSWNWRDRDFDYGLSNQIELEIEEIEESTERRYSYEKVTGGYYNGE